MCNIFDLLEKSSTRREKARVAYVPPHVYYHRRVSIMVPPEQVLSFFVRPLLGKLSLAFKERGDNEPCFKKYSLWQKLSVHMIIGEDETSSSSVISSPLILHDFCPFSTCSHFPKKALNECNEEQDPTNSVRGICTHNIRGAQ